MIRLAATLLLILAALPAGAQTPARAAADLAAAEQALASADTRAARLGALAEAIRAAETALAVMREGLRRSALREAELVARARRARDRAATGLGRLAALGRAPLAAQAAQPAGPLAAARGAWLAAALAPDRAARADALEEERAGLSRAAARQRRAWEGMRDSLAALQSARAALRAGESPALPDLSPARAALDDFAAAAPARGATPLPPPRPPAPGAVPPPVTGGCLVTPFGTTDFLGQTVTGVEIAAPLWAQIRAPSAATVRYSGPVAGRGRGLILEPAPGRLLILAGLAGTLPGVGDIVLPGDPLGHLGVITPPSPEFLVEAPFDEGALSGGLLYMELRRDGVPIDPARRFALPQGRSETP